MSATTTCQSEIVDHGVDAALGLHDRELINDLLRGTDTAQAGTESNPLWGGQCCLVPRQKHAQDKQKHDDLFFPRFFVSLCCGRFRSEAGS